MNRQDGNAGAWRANCANLKRAVHLKGRINIGPMTFLFVLMWIPVSRRWGSHFLSARIHWHGALLPCVLTRWLDFCETMLDAGATGPTPSTMNANSAFFRPSKLPA